ncbi:ABC transporter permease [Tumebacillus permanentifrigoris]|uniref:ABC-2 type transport system permease protein n=1 Tax=Tumebacillus permanentifrigoris TaxID=378543 RepID=A0A316D9T0_9BACL|nr:ABC transporter permease [Tumebacillus permanentifrigoris]PWK08949.1 ABC-2 type transport system permease protein [Tumebacillus permanentifrigoris]
MSKADKNEGIAKRTEGKSLGTSGSATGTVKSTGSSAGSGGTQGFKQLPYGISGFADIGDLYGARVRRAWLQAVLLLMSILRNQGVLIAGIALVIGAAFGYKSALNALPAAFPSAWFIAVVTAFVACRGRVRTFLQEADLVFLLPAEDRMGTYFRSAGRYSGFFQVIQSVLIIGVLVPLFQARIGLDAAWWCALGAVALKLWNLFLSWREMLLVRRRSFWIGLRFLGNALVIYALASTEWMYGVGGIVLLALVTWLVRSGRRVRSLPWNELLDQEQQTLSTYYTVANFFVDVPQIKNRVKRREWIMAIVRRIPVNQKYPYLFLYIRTFFRYSEYFGIYLRLMAFIGVILFFISNVWIALGVYLLGLFLMGFQLPMLASERRYSELVRIYPLTDQDKKRGVSWLALQLLVAESLLLDVLLLISGRLPFTQAVWLPLAGIVFSLYVSFVYLPNRFLQAEDEDGNEKKT